MFRQHVQLTAQSVIFHSIECTDNPTINTLEGWYNHHSGKHTFGQTSDIHCYIYRFSHFLAPAGGIHLIPSIEKPLAQMSIPRTKVGKIPLQEYPTGIPPIMSFQMLEWNAHLGKMLCMGG